MTGITRDLIESGYLRVAGPGTPGKGRGRPPEMLEYDAQSSYALGLELHDAAVFGVATDLYGNPRLSHTCRPVQDGPDAVIAALVSWIRTMLTSLEPERCTAIGIAVPGLVNGETGTIVYSAEFDLPPMPLADVLEEELGVRPVLTNRAPAAALAESWLGAGKDAEDLIYFRIGGYVGGAIIIDGVPYRRAGYPVASLAHLVVQPNGFPCRCGNHGCLDTVASAAAMARRARELIKSGQHSSLAARVRGNLLLVTGEMVTEEAERGDDVARHVVHEATKWLGIAVANCVNLLVPELVIIGGSVGRLVGEEYLGSLRQAARSRFVSLAGQRVRIVGTSIGLDAIACGAAATAINANLIRSINIHLP